jgi:hypothetical protein
LAVTLVDDASVRAVAGVTDVRCDTSVRGGVLVILGVGRADDVVRTVADRVRPEAVVLCASRTELAFTGPARLAQVLGEAGFAVHVTGVLGSLRVATASGRLRLSAWDGEHWVTID